ncbi:TPA: helix-hairpin-helix domain-containing protein [Streptococcus equi subsp. zooepidemicus]|uniref:DNA receptor late competence protein ComEA n=1 Tax=Streptococcus equi subsp. zooepidemicus (strain MGCS10565) TaxID=552526 RepID=B4U201_STREM|nr:helix-hairpin-helix domain-containing protein [Streptococcus equi]ACG62018.1 DNA receptor late competence protein ComEA [Streptococcus equi subsp. zooepidemicus MGCS10565]MCD3386643.1 helix-hairpin-helix domain-containing protein [Streptococcus equi subsp. zooepidemicus]MCD3387456.1 helix-hairpin-helix domain-containing protein [Streptococcus equi subsp. zooepidemicus]MCD3387463.1 helix-hairpin-helix domain-containing protein [Streptococcus equi subsp. zooepidemicus]MCD3414667.1 helix-hairp
MLEELFLKGKEMIKAPYFLSRCVTVVLSVGLLLVLWLALAGGEKARKESVSFPDHSQIQQSEKPAQPEASEQEVAAEDIVVDIKGAVHKEGVYKLAKGSRITDLIELAGGLTEQADKNAINLAEKLSDEKVIYVAKLGENISVIKEPSSETQSASADHQKPEKVHLNRASLADLQRISGIGAKRAQDIIDVRESLGGFKSLEDLRKVPGIGAKTLEKLKHDISLD